MKTNAPAGAPIQADLFAEPEPRQLEADIAQPQGASDWMCGDRWIETGSPWSGQTGIAGTRGDETAPS